MNEEDRRERLKRLEKARRIKREMHNPPETRYECSTGEHRWTMCIPGTLWCEHGRMREVT